jgi:D-arabinose 1-dehydrogenase-like Zn-dependent alcohol dehydrogenase
MPATSRGVTLLGPDKLEIREYPIPDIPSDGGLVKIELGGVCGSDVKYLHGGKAQLPYPLILGHEILGRVEKLGKNAATIHGVKEGDRIILKGSKGCGRCAHCRRGGARFCKSSATVDKRLAPTRPTCLAALPITSILCLIFWSRRSATSYRQKPPFSSAP